MPSANPQVPQGQLNRLRGSITFSSFPGLNVTASYLGREGLGLNFEGQATLSIDTMTGVVQSPEPYVKASVMVHLIKTQALAALFKAQIENSTLLGDATVRTDATSLPPYQLSNCAISTVNAIKIDGTDAGWVIMITGIYYINSALWNV